MPSLHQAKHRRPHRVNSRHIPLDGRHSNPRTVALPILDNASEARHFGRGGVSVGQFAMMDEEAFREKLAEAKSAAPAVRGGAGRRRVRGGSTARPSRRSTPGCRTGNRTQMFAAVCREYGPRPVSLCTTTVGDGPSARPQMAFQPHSVDRVQPASDRARLYFRNVATALVTRAMGSDGDENTIDRR